MASATTLQAATQAVQRDAAGDAANAIIFYEQAAEGLAADCTAVGQGPEVDAMRAKSDEYLARARVLRAQSASLPVAPDGGAPAGGGVDPNAVMGALAAGQQAQATLAAAEKKGGWQMYAGAAGAGALGGAMVIGSVIGAPIMVGLLVFLPPALTCWTNASSGTRRHAVSLFAYCRCCSYCVWRQGAMAGAGALAYATTREDGMGEAARTVGTGTSNAVVKAREVNAEYLL